MSKLLNAAALSFFLTVAVISVGVILRSENPFEQVPLIFDYYSPHASDILVVCAFWAFLWRPRYKPWGAFVYFLLLDGIGEVWFNLTYGLYHFRSLMENTSLPPQFGNPVTVAKMCVFVGGTILLWALLKPKVKPKGAVMPALVWACIEGFVLLTGYPASWTAAIGEVNVVYFFLGIAQFWLLSSLITMEEKAKART